MIWSCIDVVHHVIALKVGERGWDVIRPRRAIGPSWLETLDSDRSTSSDGRCDLIGCIGQVDDVWFGLVGSDAKVGVGFLAGSTGSIGCGRRTGVDLRDIAGFRCWRKSR